MKDYYKYTGYTYVEEFKRLDFIVGQVQKNVTPPAKILDIGCGNGNLSMVLGSLGYEVKGIDVDSTSIDTAKKK
ncbi:methyltransferase domain-containing protein [Oscillatoria amoena NRMC-F 0135]|nr:methyltransferase domain-containing protein [Oscillatoria amoena NRMC-F 0135]